MHPDQLARPRDRVEREIETGVRCGPIALVRANRYRMYQMVHLSFALDEPGWPTLGNSRGRGQELSALGVRSWSTILDVDDAPMGTHK
jgi:hypothetical protein